MNLERTVADLVEKIERRFYGKYRAVVVDNQDPVKIGRLRLRVPSVLGGDVVTGWALPCVPSGGAANQGFLFIPDIGAGVWAEFEEGDLEFPIWVGSFWSEPEGATEVPTPYHADGTGQEAVQDPPTAKIVKTAKKHTLQFEDADGAEMILIREGVKGHFVVMDQNGITIKDANGNSNSITFTSGGITIADCNGNAIEMSASALNINAGNRAMTITAKSIDFQQGS